LPDGPNRLLLNERAGCCRRVHDHISHRGILCELFKQGMRNQPNEDVAATDGDAAEKPFPIDYSRPAVLLAGFHLVVNVATKILSTLCQP
jgi:hypothetical protein